MGLGGLSFTNGPRRVSVGVCTCFQALPFAPDQLRRPAIIGHPAVVRHLATVPRSPVHG